MISGILVGLAGGTGGEAAAGAVGPGKQCFLKQEVAGQFPINGVLLGTDQDIPVFVTGQSVDEKGAPLVDTDGKPLWDVTFLGLGMASRRADRPADRVMRSVLLTVERRRQPGIRQPEQRRSRKAAWSRHDPLREPGRAAWCEGVSAPEVHGGSRT